MNGLLDIFYQMQRTYKLKETGKSDILCNPFSPHVIICVSLPYLSVASDKKPLKVYIVRYGCCIFFPTKQFILFTIKSIFAVDNPNRLWFRAEQKIRWKTER